MGPVTIFLICAFVSQVLGSGIIKPRGWEDMVKNRGLETYHDHDTFQIDYDSKSIDGYQFNGASVFDLPETIGILHQVYPREVHNGRERIATDKIEERMVAYAIAEKSILVFGIPFSNEVTRSRNMAKYPTREEKTKKVMEHISGLDASITLRYFEGKVLEYGDGSGKVKDVLSRLKKEGGKILTAGVLGLQGPNLFKSPIAFDAVGQLLSQELGVEVKPWQSYYGKHDTRAFLVAVDNPDIFPVIEMTIGSELVMKLDENGGSWFPTKGKSVAISRWSHRSYRGAGELQRHRDNDNNQNDNQNNPNHEDKPEDEDDCMDVDDDGDDEAAESALHEIFHMKAGRTKGGCDAQQKTIGNWFKEAKEMAEAGLQAFSDAKDGNKVAKDTLQQFFGVTSDTPSDETEALRLWLQDVYDFYQGELELDVGTPWLFCGSTWLEQKERDDPSLDSNGDVKHDNEGQVLEIQNDPLYIEDMWVWQDEKKSPGALVPYWSSDIKKYVFQEDYKGKGYCIFTQNMGGADYRTKPFTMEMCPKAFTSKSDAEKLGSRSASSNKLQDLVPRSSTFFHESFHLLHTWESPDATYYVDTILKALKSPEDAPDSINLDTPDPDYEENVDQLRNLDLIRQNPETWVFFCVAYWYTLNKKVYFPDGKKGVPIE